MDISPYQGRKIIKVIIFGGFWFFFGLLYTFLEKGLLGDSTIYPSTKNPYDFATALIVTPLGSAITGFLLGMMEIKLGKSFIKRSFTNKIALKTLIYVITVVVFLIVISLINSSVRMNLPINHENVIAQLVSFITNFAFWSVVLYAGTFIGITLFVVEVSENLGLNVLKNFLTGRYHHPIAEQRVFMFLDMKSSTTIAEKLGHQRYYELLNEYYEDITPGIVNRHGEIYQYVGDEVIISWELNKGLDHHNCIRCFFDVKRTYNELAEKYMNEFGLVPEFKAGLHCGPVTTGEIGVFKKEILFTGDVLNTTSRIQGQCNELKVDILISEELLTLLQPDNEFKMEEMGITELRGRNKKIKLFTAKNINT